MSAPLSPEEIEHYSNLIATLASRQEKGIKIVGIFDSGGGGLTVLPPLNDPVPFFDIFYRGDTAHFPYGEKSTTELLPLVLANLEYLVDCGCSIVGIACNTASIVWRDILTQLPTDQKELVATVIIDTISSAMDALSLLESHTTIGIIGTSFTVHSGAYEAAIRRQFPDASPIILQSAEQTLVNAIERGERAAIELELARILAFFGQRNLDVFILGCTHYGHIASVIAAALPPHVQLLDPSVQLGQALRRRLLPAPDPQRTAAPPRLNVMFTGTTPASCVY